MVDISRASKDLRLALTGDTIAARNGFLATGGPTGELVELIRECDAAFTNLEVLPNDFAGYPAARSDGVHFATHSGILDELAEAGFGLFGYANNHALDYGVEGLLQALSEFEQRGLTYAGAGKTLAQARMPAYLDQGWGSVGLVACSSTFFPEQAAGEQTPDVQGRPGINPLRFGVTYEVSEEQLACLQSIAGDLGLESQRREFVQLGFLSDPEDLRILPFVDTNLRVAGTLDAKFRAADSPAVRTRPEEPNAREILRWIAEARNRAEVVVVSLHAHEQGKSREHPAEFVESFARAAVDAGADMVTGHGPHLLRGMEMYHGKPIFYSLGNFVGQNELVYKLPADSYRRFGVDQSLTPSEVFRIRNADGTKGFPADELYWQTVMPICRFESGKLVEIEVVPVSITHGKTPNTRGQPYLANGEEATKILAKFASLSREYGVKISDGDRSRGEGLHSERALVEL